MPICRGDHVFGSTAYRTGSALVKLAKAGDGIRAEEEYFLRSDVLQNHHGGLIRLGDYIYGVDSYGELRCLDARNGDRVWEDLTATVNDRWGNIHFVRNGDRIWMFNELGELIIAKLSPGGFREISRAKLIEPTRVQLNRRGGVCWSHPAFADKHVFVRNDEKLVCVNLSAR